MSSEGKFWDSHYSDRVEKCLDSVSVSYGIGSKHREVTIIGIRLLGSAFFVDSCDIYAMHHLV